MAAGPRGSRSAYRASPATRAALLGTLLWAFTEPWTRPDLAVLGVSPAREGFMVAVRARCRVRDHCPDRVGVRGGRGG